MAGYTRSRQAERDLKDIWLYIASESSPKQADKLLDKLEATFEKLTKSPGMGTRRDYLEPELLGFPTANNIIFTRKPMAAFASSEC